MSDSILFQREGRVATVSLNHPPLNILDLPTIAELGRRLDELRQDENLQLLILRGTGGKAFSAGVAVEDHTQENVPKMLALFHQSIRTLREIPAVTLAVVEGHCLGGGMELAAGCDLVLATESSKFGQPEIKLGCYPPLAAALYPGLLGYGRTVDLLVTGRTIDCSEAERIGFVTYRVEKTDLDSKLSDLIADLTSYSQVVTRLTVQAIRASRSRDFESALEESERLYLEELLETKDMNEGIRSFLEKRSPVWKHR